MTGAQRRLSLKGIEICEVAPRDGLQNESQIWSVDQRVALIDRLSEAGLRRIEAVSFVNPKRVPQMAGAEEVMLRIDRKPDVRYAGLALNRRGVERALAADMDEVRCVVVATETFNRRNNGVAIADTIAGFCDIADVVHSASKRLTFGIAAAFGCPFEGVVPAETVLDIARRLLALQPDEIWLADTIGAGVPNQVRDLTADLAKLAGPGVPVGGHFHNTRNTGYANAVAAIEGGALFLDAAVGGIGGCPFAPRATGNIASEDLCLMLRNMGIETGIDLAALIAVSDWVNDQMDRPVPAMVAKAGLFPEIAETKEDGP